MRLSIFQVSWDVLNLDPPNTLTIIFEYAIDMISHLNIQQLFSNNFWICNTVSLALWTVEGTIGTPSFRSLSGEFLLAGSAPTSRLEPESVGHTATEHWRLVRFLSFWLLNWSVNDQFLACMTWWSMFAKFVVHLKYLKLEKRDRARRSMTKLEHILDTKESSCNLNGWASQLH